MEPTPMLSAIVGYLLNLATEKGSLCAELTEEETKKILFPEGHDTVPQVRNLVLTSNHCKEVALEFSSPFGVSIWMGYKYREMVRFTNSDPDGVSISELQPGQAPIFKAHLDGVTPRDRTHTIQSIIVALVSGEVVGSDAFDPNVPLMLQDPGGKLVVKVNGKFFSQGEDGLFKETPEPEVWYESKKRAFGEGLYL